MKVLLLSKILKLDLKNTMIDTNTLFNKKLIIKVILIISKRKKYISNRMKMMIMIMKNKRMIYNIKIIVVKVMIMMMMKIKIKVIDFFNNLIF